MNSRFLLLFVSLILAIAVASAQLAIYNPTNISTSHNTNATGTFILGNTNLTNNVTGIVCTVSSTVPGSIGTTNCQAVLSGNLTSNTNASLTYWVFVPQYTVPNNYTATITATGTGSPLPATKNVNVAVSATPSLALSWSTGPSDIYQGSNATGTVNITNNGNVALNVNLSATFANVTINLTSFALNPSESVLRTVSVNTSTKTPVGTNTLSVSAFGNSSYGTTTTTLESAIEVKYNFCSANSTNYPIYIEEITNKDTLEDKDFKPSDSFTVKVKVHNSDSSDSKYAVVRAVLMKSAKIDGTEEESSSQKISADSTKSFSLNITIPSDIAKGDYYLFVKAYDDDKSSNCEQRTVKIHFIREDYEIGLKDVEIPSTIECDNVLEVQGTLENLGSKYEDKVRMFYSDGLFSDNIVFDELESGDQKEFSFAFSVPKNTTEKTYTATLRVYYNYDDNDETYGDSTSFNYNYAVSGNCFKEIRNVSLSSLSQTAFIAKDSDVTFALANTGNVAETYTISAASADFTVKSITPSTIVLPAGSTVSVAMKVAAKEGTAPGMHNLAVTISYGGKTETKTISLDVQNASAISGTYNYIKEKFSNAPWLTVFNIVLVLVIIGLVVKLFVLKPAAKAAPAVASAFKSNIKKNFK